MPILQPKLITEILLKFTGGELDIHNPQSCHYRGEIAEMDCATDRDGRVRTVKVRFRWLLPKLGERLIPQDAVRVWEPNKFWMVFAIEKVFYVRDDEVKLQTNTGPNEILTFIASTNAKLDRFKFENLRSRELL